MSLKLKFVVPMLAVILGVAAMPAFAQNNGGGGGNGGGQGGQGGRGGRGGGWNPQAQMDQLKTDLGATDDEFAALQPKIEKVQQLQRDIMFGGRGFGGRRGGGGQGGQGGGQGNATASPVAAASADLQKTLQDKDAKPEDIKAKLEAFRAAKKTAREDLVKAQEDLKSVLTQRQEAVLVEHGTLD